MSDDRFNAGLKLIKTQSVATTTPSAAAENSNAALGLDAVGQSEIEAANLEIARAIESGNLSADAACQQLIGEAVRTQLPSELPAEMVQSVCNEIEFVLSGDPTLAALLRPSATIPA